MDISAFFLCRRRGKCIILPDGINVPVKNMSGSPVVELLTDLVHIDRKSNKAVYMQIADQMDAAVRGGLVPPGTLLPGSRQLSAALAVHRKTVVAAYEELALQNVVRMLPNKGTYVNQMQTAGLVAAFGRQDNRVLPEQSSLPVPNNRILEWNRLAVKSLFSLDDGLPDMRLFQPEKLGMGAHALFKNKGTDKAFLHYQLQQYFRESQHLETSENQLLTTANRNMSVFMVAQALLRSGDAVAVGAPGNFRVNMALQQAGAVLHTVQVDSEGIQVEELDEICKKNPLKIVYVNTSHHYPTGVSLSYRRRLALLELAEKYRFFLIEDETDALIDYRKRKIPSLLTLQDSGCVIGIHSFEQVLRPDWNVSTIIAPAKVLSEIGKYQALIGMERGHYGESIVAAALQSGGLQRLLKRNTRIYQQRASDCMQLLEPAWGKSVRCEMPRSGLAMWLEFEWDFNLVQFGRQCAMQGIFIPQELLYQSRIWTAMRLGFGKWDREEMEKITAIGKKLLVP